ncbi:MAG: hypothetical protein COV46_02710 [Deltaproteobacteria bacterium CG11_big_fil_rev_8_21_14_0_20_49_13]|nr:MAG: hypothetical protein COV46_02710 [Deltaproteobacteria bacterium CG11_big_fil_rev_8_21_14_0_20_49_13]
MRIIKYSIFGLFVLSVAPLYAASLSDLNTKGFQDRTTPPVRATENPFMKQNASPQDMVVEDLHLDGIVYSPHSSYALISGFTVREDDDVAGLKVKVIEKDRVVLRQLDQMKILRLD